MTTRRDFVATAGRLALRPQAAPAEPDVVRAVVAQDGSGDYQTIQRAVDHVLDRPPRSLTRVVLEIRPGVYHERVKIPQDRPPSLTLKGRDAASTVISYNMSAAAAGGTFFSSIVEVNSGGFEAENITFQNTFGTGSQAVAICLHSDRAQFRNCRFLGWQDTLYAAAGRHYYRDCYIEGHVDFIFGNAAAVFDGCEIHSRAAGFIAAHSRTSAEQPTGYVFRDCRLTGAEGLTERVYLGRPWRSCARVVYLNCWMGAHIRPEGWDNWGQPENEKTAWFAELGSKGPGANPEARVRWARSITAAEAAAFAPEAFLKGNDGWNPRAIL